MSASRKYRRVKTTWRRPDTELCAAARRLVAEVIAAHDDPEVAMDDFRAILRSLGDHVIGCSEAERLEAMLQVHQHAMRSLAGRPQLTAVAIADLS